MDPGEYSLVRIEAPSETVATLDEAKRHCSVVADDDDSLLQHYLAAATEQVERDTNLRLLSQTWRMRRHNWPCDRFLELPGFPLQDVTAIRYADLDGATQEMHSELYVVDTDRRPGRVWLMPEADWPSADTEVPNGIEIEFILGWAEPPAAPLRAKQALLLLVGHWYRSRESVVIGAASSLPHAYDALIQSLRGGQYP